LDTYDFIIILIVTRLDFQTFQIANPAATGACTTDTFIVKGTSGKNPPTVCGTLTGQHSKFDWLFTPE
jgi:hypothetical protein